MNTFWLGACFLGASVQQSYDSGRSQAAFIFLMENVRLTDKIWESFQNKFGPKQVGLKITPPRKNRYTYWKKRQSDLSQR
jgi:hypothetical protein